MTFANVLSWLNSNAETIEPGGEVAFELKKEVTGLLKLYAKKGMGELGEQCLEDLVEVMVVMVTKQVTETVNQTREVEVLKIMRTLQEQLDLLFISGGNSPRSAWCCGWRTSSSCCCCWCWQSSSKTAGREV